MTDDLRTKIAKVLYMWYAEDIPYQTETCGDDWEAEGESCQSAWLQQADAVIAELGLQPVKRSTRFPERRWVTPWELIDPMEGDDE